MEERARQRGAPGLGSSRPASHRSAAHSHLGRLVRLAQGGPPGVKGGAGVGLCVGVSRGGVERGGGIRGRGAVAPRGRGAPPLCASDTAARARPATPTHQAPSVTSLCLSLPLTLAANTAAWWWSRVSRPDQGTEATSAGAPVDATAAPAAASRSAASRAVGWRMATDYVCRVCVCACGRDARARRVRVCRALSPAPAETNVRARAVSFFLLLIFSTLATGTSPPPPAEERALSPLPTVRGPAPELLPPLNTTLTKRVAGPSCWRRAPTKKRKTARWPPATHLPTTATTRLPTPTSAA